MMLERFIEYVNSHTGVSWRTMEDIASRYRQAHPFSDKPAAQATA
jgi:hypothetical protein